MDPQAFRFVQMQLPIYEAEGFEIHCYIDDYIAVVPREKADFVFATLCKTHNELSLLIDKSKLPPNQVSDLPGY